MLEFDTHCEAQGAWSTFFFFQNQHIFIEPEVAYATCSFVAYDPVYQFGNPSA